MGPPLSRELDGKQSSTIQKKTNILETNNCYIQTTLALLPLDPCSSTYMTRLSEHFFIR
jgi:hypothetical protein